MDPSTYQLIAFSPFKRCDNLDLLKVVEKNLQNRKYSPNGDLLW